MTKYLNGAGYMLTTMINMIVLKMLYTGYFGYAFNEEVTLFIMVDEVSWFVGVVFLFIRHDLDAVYTALHVFIYDRADF